MWWSQYTACFVKKPLRPLNLTSNGTIIEV